MTDEPVRRPADAGQPDDPDATATTASVPSSGSATGSAPPQPPPPTGPSAAGPPPPPADASLPPGGYGPSPGAAFTARYGLVRPREGRYLAGVCAAVGRATNTDPLLWRVLLAVLGFFGGIGILLYVMAWLIIPAEGDTASPVESMLGRGRSSMSPVTVILLGVLVAVIFAFIVTDGFSSVLLGTAILVGGALLLNREANRQRPAQDSAFTPAAGPGVPPAAGGIPEPSGATYPFSASPDVGSHPTSAAGEPGHPAGAATPPAYPGAPSEPTYPTASAGPAWTSPTPSGPTPAGGYRPPFAPYGPYAGGPTSPPPVAPPPPRPPRERSPLGAATFSLMFVVLGLIAVVDLTDALPVGPSAYFAGVLVTTALGLLVGTWFGRARWLIALGLAAAVALGIATLAESTDVSRLQGGSVLWQPASIDELTDRYENNFGEATLDLRSVELGPAQRDVTVQVNFGRLVVYVPDTADVTAFTDVNAGDATVFGQRWGGMQGSGREITDLGPDGPGGGELRLYLHVNAGEVQVRR